MESPAATTSGNVVTRGTWNAGDEDVMFEMRSVHGPRLLSTKLRSANSPRQTSPKLPAFATAVSRDAVPWSPVAKRSRTGAFGSLLTMAGTSHRDDIPVEI